MANKTPEQIEDMRKQVEEFDRQQAVEQAEAARAQAKPLIDLVEGDAFKAIEAAIPALDELSVMMPDVRVHVDAIRHGCRGLRQTVELLPQLPALETPAPPAAPE